MQKEMKGYTTDSYWLFRVGNNINQVVKWENTHIEKPLILAVPNNGLKNEWIIQKYIEKF